MMTFDDIDEDDEEFLGGAWSGSQFDNEYDEYHVDDDGDDDDGDLGVDGDDGDDDDLGVPLHHVKVR